MKFENKNLIIIEGKNEVQIDTLEELEEIFFGKEYASKEENDKLKDRYAKIYPYSLLAKKNVYLDMETLIERGKLKKVENIDINNGLFINNDINFFLSLCKVDQIQILEKIESNIFTGEIDKTKMKGNYVSVNIFANEIITKNLNIILFF